MERNRPLAENNLYDWLYKHISNSVKKSTSDINHESF